MTIDLLQTVRRALDEKWDRPEALRLLLLGMLDHVEGMERLAASRTAPPQPPLSDDFGTEIREVGRPPKPQEPPIRIIKEGHIPPRTDGYVSWWRRLVSGKRSDGVNEDPRVKSARELYGVDAADYYKAKDREREAGRQFAINVAETVARLKRFVAQYQRSE
jgi:hypothetical protein